MTVEYFRANCGAAGAVLPNGGIIESYSGRFQYCDEVCTADERRSCPYLVALEAMPEGAGWEAVNGCDALDNALTTRGE